MLTAAGWHRRLIAGLLAAASVVFTLSALAPAPTTTVPLLVASTDLSPGEVPTAGTVHVTHVPTTARPPGALTDAGQLSGRSLLVPRRAGAPISDDVLMSPGLLAGYGRDSRAVTVRIADPGSLVLVRIGDAVDVLAATTIAGADGAVGSAHVVARDVPVLALPVADDTTRGGLLVVAASSRVAAVLAGAEVTGRLSVVVRPAG